MKTWRTCPNAYDVYRRYLNREIDSVNRSLYNFLVENEYKMSLETNDEDLWNEYKEQYERWLDLRKKIEEVDAFDRIPKQNFVGIHG